MAENIKNVKKIQKSRKNSKISKKIQKFKNVKKVRIIKKMPTVFFNMLTNVEIVLVNENITQRRRKLCSFMLFNRIL